MDFKSRLVERVDELKWLYMELYNNSSMFAELIEEIEVFYKKREAYLKKLDEEREADPEWYKGNDMLGI